MNFRRSSSQQHLRLLDAQASTAAAVSERLTVDLNGSAQSEMAFKKILCLCQIVC